MPAFIVVEIEVVDNDRYEAYKLLAPPSIAVYGGRYVVRGGKSETLEGGWSPKRVVILEFPSLEKAKALWSSEEYAQAKALRHATAHSKMIVVEGL